jgi:small-conductance mechanosensitive channel
MGKYNVIKKKGEMIWIRIVLILFAFTVIATFLAGCQSGSIPGLGSNISTPPPEQSGNEEVAAQPTEEQVLSTPTPAPTATPSGLDFLVRDVSNRMGGRDLSIFGLDGEDWINLFVSVLIVLVGGAAGSILISGLLWIARRMSPSLNLHLLKGIGDSLKWLIVLFALQFATERLAILPPRLKQWLDLIYFALFVLLAGVIIWKLVDYSLEKPLVRASSPEQRDLLVAFTPLLRRLLQVLIIIVGLAIVLQRFGVNLTALLAVLGLGGLAVSLAAKETLEDMINGFIILIDRPFNIGDRIKIESMDDWGDVEDIGSRTTRIRTLDNRLVIVPNSLIGNSQVENYTHPDPSFGIDISLGIAYGSDIDRVIDIITRAILSIQDLLHEKEPIVDFVEFGDSAMVFRVVYWLKTYKDIRLRSQVNQSIIGALSESGIELPFVTYDVNLAYKDQNEMEIINR